MLSSHIVFYEPKSTAASITGVFLKMGLLLLPAIILAVFLAQQDDPEWLWVLAALVCGVLLMIKSDFIVFPLIGTRNEFHFDNDTVTIRNAAGEKQVRLADLLSLTAFDVPAEGGSVKHIVLEFAGGQKTDIFETWVTASSTGDFDKLYHALLKKGSSDVSISN